MIKAGTIILKNNFLKLNVLWNMVFSNKPYDSEEAQRRFLQMPVVSVNVGSGVYLCGKKNRPCLLVLSKMNLMVCYTPCPNPIANS